VHQQRILIVDDNKTLAWVLRKSLNERGYLCGVVHTQEAALQAIEMNSFDVVVTDLHLRPGNGLALLADIKRRSPTTLRLLMSGTMEPGERVDPAVVQGHLQKPVVAQELGALIERTRGAPSGGRPAH
jgi:DNA-binding NtrC family response regulator